MATDQLERYGPLNVGAEILFEMLQGSRWKNDTDGDGLPEACDQWGEPLIFLSRDIESDVIILSGGLRQEVTAPPNVSLGFYVSSLRLHCWCSEDQAVIERVGE